MYRVFNLPIRPILTLGFATVASALLGQPLPQSSPFLPPKESSTPYSAAAKYQLGGMVTKGKDVLINITRVSDKQSVWVPIGGTVDEITAVSYVPELDEAVISANGERFTLRLRQAVGQGGNGVASTAGSAGTMAISAPLPPPVGGPEVQEREARMLVTDLLEIGQAHRKAYEEAQKKAAVEKKK